MYFKSLVKSDYNLLKRKETKQDGNNKTNVENFSFCKHMSIWNVLNRLKNQFKIKCM